MYCKFIKIRLKWLFAFVYDGDKKSYFLSLSYTNWKSFSSKDTQLRIIFVILSHIQTYNGLFILMHW